MRLFLQIDIGDWKQRDYKNLLVPYASSLASDLIGTDIDNESESTVVDLVMRLVEQAESVLVFISAKPDGSIGSADKVLHYLGQQRNIQTLVILGKHPGMEKHAQNFDERFLSVNDHEGVKKLIHAFAKKITPDQTSGLVP